VQWVPPAPEKQKRPEAKPSVPVEKIREKFAALTLADAVDTALKNNPATRIAWADARAAADNYYSTLGSWLPDVTLNGAINRASSVSPLSRELSTGIPPSPPYTSYSAAANLSYLLFDFGGRFALVEESRQALLAADWTHNAVIQNTVLDAQFAFFGYAGAKAMLEASMTSLSEAEANLAAAEERHRVGLATSADVLQAKTAYSEVKLAVLDAEGQVRTTRGALAASMGYPANLPYEINVVPPQIPGSEFSASVDQLINQALASQPDLQTYRALALQSAASVRQAWSAMLPSLSVTGSAGRSWVRDKPGYIKTYGGSLLLELPLFTGFSQQFNLLRAKAEADAARERARSLEQTVILQVFSSHSAFLTASERLNTTDDLMESATQSEKVALGRYKEGVGSILDLLSAQQALAQARAEQVNARLGWFTALAQLAHDVGILGVHGDNPLTPGTSKLR